MQLRMEWIYHTNERNTARYALGVRGKKMLACIGVNPSTAEPGKLDATMQSVQRIAFHNGFDGWLMFNLYPQRSTDPKGLHKRPNGKIFQENIAVYRELINLYHIQDIWLAWGNLISTRSYLSKSCQIMLDLDFVHCDYWTVGRITKAGHPGHPLYKKANSKLDRFCSVSYLKEHCAS